MMDVFHVYCFNALNTSSCEYFFLIIDSRISFYCNSLDHLQPKLKVTLWNLKKGV